jgi:hypothetical protein
MKRMLPQDLMPESTQLSGRSVGDMAAIEAEAALRTLALTTEVETPVSTTRQ